MVSEGAFHGLVESDKAQVRDRDPNAKKNDLTPDSIDLAQFMRSDLGKYAEENHKIKLTVKYLDPRQVVRASPANSTDTDLCHKIAYVTAHSVMDGFTDYAAC